MARGRSHGHSDSATSHSMKKAARDFDAEGGNVLYGEPESQGFDDLANERSLDSRLEIDVGTDCYPYCIVWTMLPGITWMLPPVGHIGIGDSRGRVWEFMGFGATRGPEGGLSFAPVVRYVQLDPKKAAAGWDEGLRAAIEGCEGRVHMGCCNNCHSFVADALNYMEYRTSGCPWWNQVAIGALLFFRGSFTTVSRSTLTFFPAILFFIFYFLPKFMSKEET
jgi:hypothetical protein